MTTRVVGHWAAISGRNKDPDREPRPRRRATYNRNDGVRHLFAAYDLTRDRLFGHVKTRKKRAHRDRLRQHWPIYSMLITRKLG